MSVIGFSGNDDSHKPVLLKESIEHLRVESGKLYIDGTLGMGGHTLEILKRGGGVLGIDADEESLKRALKRIEDEAGANRSNFFSVRGNFRDIARLAKDANFFPVSGILFDLGISSWTLEQSGRGFSFNRDEPLDMRLNKSLSVTASDLVNGLYEKELAELFSKYGDEPRANLYARVIVDYRKKKKIESSTQLADIIKFATREKHSDRHPATRVFQALRIAVNDEIGALEGGLNGALELLESGGRLVVISFHSLEDRVVKRRFKEWEDNRKVTIVTPKPIIPSDSEVSNNLRSRSAKLRVVYKN